MKAVLMKFYESDNELRGIFPTTAEAEKYINHLVRDMYSNNERKAKVLRSMLCVVEASGMYAVYQYDRPVRLYTTFDESEKSITTQENSMGYHVIAV